MARPTTYSEEFGASICERLIEGESLRAICRSDTGPGLSTVFQWLLAVPSFAEQYARAREVQAHIIFDDTKDMVDNEPDPAKARVMLDQRKWATSKLLPKVYGDKLELRHGDPNGNALAPATISLTIAKAPEGE